MANARSNARRFEHDLRQLDALWSSAARHEAELPQATPLVARELARQPVVSVLIEPPWQRPATIAVPYAPPPMLVDVPPPPPFAQALWICGHWAWEGAWVWARGLWSGRPRAGMRWVHPSYLHLDGEILFTAGHWTRADEAPPSPELQAAHAQPAAMAAPGTAPQGPFGSCVPAPPGSRPGLIVPAPHDTAPAVLTCAPPICRSGIQVRALRGDDSRLEISAPASATANGEPVLLLVPAAAHLAAALAPCVPSQAPAPLSQVGLTAFSPGRRGGA